MQSLDEIFYKEFTNMMNSLKGINGQCSLTDIALPPEAEGRFFIEKKQKVLIRGITEDYYNKLNESEVLLWGSSAMRRRKYDYKGEFITDKDGRYILQDVPCPNDCVGIISTQSIGVPAKYRSKDSCQYVDMVSKRGADGKMMHRFVYIVPKKFCYQIKQTALVLSWNKLRRFYSGNMLSMQNGSYLYLYIVPYNPSSQVHSYRVLHCKTSVDYSAEISLLKNYWIENNIIFNPAWCQLDDFFRGRENMAYLPLNGTEDIYERFDESRPLGEVETFEDIEYAET